MDKYGIERVRSHWSRGFWWQWQEDDAVNWEAIEKWSVAGKGSSDCIF